MKIKELFGEFKVVGLAGKKSSGKTNNLVALIKDFREKNSITKIYVYGFDEISLKYLKKLKNIFEISSLEQLSSKKDCLIIIDEMQKLHLSDKRYKDLLDKFVDFIYHSNNWVIFTSPNIREFNSIIGSKIERWAIKSLKFKDLVNGSQLKEVVFNYHGRFKVFNDIKIDENRLLIINDDFEKVIKLDYIEEIDLKLEKENIFEIKKSKR